MKIATIGYYKDCMGENSTECFSSVGLLLIKALRARGHLVYPYHILEDLPGGEPVDIIIATTYCRHASTLSEWKIKLKSKKLVSFLEVDLEGVDHSFMYNKDIYIS